MHVQVGTPGWIDGLLAMPDGTLLKAVDDPGLLLAGWEAWTAAGRDPARLHLDYRHHDLYLPLGDWESLKAQWRAMFFRFINRTYLERYAPIVTLVEENNEYFTNQSVREQGLARYLDSARAAVAVWNGEFRGRTVTSPDGGQGAIRADCRLVLANGFVTHDTPRAYMQLALDEDALLAYHNYALFVNGERAADDWRNHSGLWDRNEQAAGLRPRWAFTEQGPYNGTAEGGWRAGNCLGGDRARLVAGLRAVYGDVTRTAAYREGRLCGPGALFTIGGNDTGWPQYELERDDLVAIGGMLREIWHPGDYRPMAITTLVVENVPESVKAAYVEHLQAMTEHVNAGNAPYPYGPSGGPPPLFWAVTLGAGLALRDLAGNPAHHPVYAPTGSPAGVVQPGTRIPIYAEGVSATTAYQRRATITPEGLNVWQGQPGSPTYRRE